MMPKLPEPVSKTVWDSGAVTGLYSRTQMLDFARAVAEECAAICDHNTDYVSANAIREAAKEIK